MLKKSLLLSVVVIITYVSVAYILVRTYNYNGPEIQALVFAAILALLNFILALIFIDKNLTKKQKEFINALMKSTILRLVIILAIFFTIILFVPLNHFVFSIGFFILYFLFQMIEIYVLHTNKQAGKY
jgi:hypothetical protein